MAEYTILQVKRDSTLNWYASNPRLALGEPGVDMDLHRFKIGNGIDRWNELPYMDDDLYRLLDEQAQRTADYVQDLLNRMAANKLDADQKYNAATTEIRNTSRELTGRMTAVETGQQEYQENLTERQQEFEEAVTGDFEDTKTEVQAGLDKFNQTRDQLTTRMNAIAGQATEDTEVLDARIDAEYLTHPNLSTNIRHIHTQLLEAKQSYAEDKAELDAQIAGLQSIGTQEQQARLQADTAHDARLSQLEDDAGKLFAKDEALQEQADTNADEILKTALIVADEMLRTREEFARVDSERVAEQQAREHEDTELLARLDAEHRGRVAEDEAISARVDAEAHELQHERLKSADDTEELGRRIDEIAGAVTEETYLLSETDERLRAETARRIKADEELSLMHDKREDFLQEQADETASEVISLNINLYEEQQARKQVDNVHDAQIEELSDELEDTRENLREEAEHAKAETDKVAEAVLNAGCEIFREREERISTDETLAETIAQNDQRFTIDLRHEELARIEDVKRLDAELRPVAETLIREGLDRYAEHTRLQQRVEHEEKLSASRDEFQNEQINELGAVTLQQALSIYHEERQKQADIQAVNERVDDDSDALRNEELHREEKDKALQEQTDKAAEAVLSAGIEIYAGHEKLKHDIERERQARITSIEKVQDQADDLSEASLKTTLNILREAKKYYRLEESDQTAAKIRAMYDAGLQAQIDMLAVLKLREALERYEEYSRQKNRIEHEALTTEAREEFQNKQINDLAAVSMEQALMLFREGEGRREDVRALTERIVSEEQIRTEFDGQIADDLRHETQSRVARDEALQRQVDNTAETLLDAACEVYGINERLGTKIEHEAQTRITSVEKTQEQADDLAEASLKNTLNISREANKRRELEQRLASEEQTRAEFDRHTTDDLKHEALLRVTHDDALQAQTDKSTEALLRAACELFGMSERLGAKIDREKYLRTINAEKAQAQENELTDAILQTLITGYRAREKINARVKAIETVLVTSGMLEESDIPYSTDTEIEGMIEDIFSGNTTSGTVEPDDEEEAEFLEDIYNIFNP